MPKPKIEIDIKTIEQLASRGLTLEQIASSMGFSVRTLMSRKTESAEIAEAIKRGKAKANIFVGGKLMQKIKAGDTASIIFYLKTRCGWKETQKIEADVTQRDVPEGLPAIYAALKKQTK